jgi:hypothetical protein
LTCREDVHIFFERTAGRAEHAGLPLQPAHQIRTEESKWVIVRAERERRNPGVEISPPA